MDFVVTKRFLNDFAKLPKSLQDKVAQRVTELAEIYGGITPGGWHVEKLSPSQLWSCRVNANFRIIFSVSEDRIVYKRVAPHDVYKKR